MWTTRSMAFGYSDPGTGAPRKARTTWTASSMAIGSSETRIRYGDVEEGPYVQGERHGKWVKMSPDGRVAEAHYAKGGQGQTDRQVRLAHAGRPQKANVLLARERATGYRSMPDRSVEQEHLRSRLSDPHTRGLRRNSTCGGVWLSAASDSVAHLSCLSACGDALVESADGRCAINGRVLT